MNTGDLNSRISARGKEIFNSIQNEKPSLFNKGAWMGKIMDWSMKNEMFKIQLFRFVDVFPALTTNKLLTDHIKEYFGDEKDMPSFLTWGAKAAGALGSVGSTLLNKALSVNIQEMARQFIVGENSKEAIKNMENLREEGFAFVVDVLGEVTLTEDEAEAYTNTYLELLDQLKKEQTKWIALGERKEDTTYDWGCTPKVNVAVKPTALCCSVNPLNFEGSVNAILQRVRKICSKVVELGGFLCIDIESYQTKDITIEVYRRLKLEYPNYPHLGIALQAYLKDTDKDLESLLSWAKQHNLQISIRLVKGAYWDYETVKAKQNGWQPPVWTIKAESDAAYERQARKILEHHSICYFACASHNIRTISAVIELARELNVPDNRYEFQVLYGMAEPVRKAILKATGRVRLYCPYGAMVPGMSYLVRRLLENTANESFLRQSFAEEAQIEKLLEDPVITADLERAKHKAESHQTRNDGLLPFRNEPMVNFTDVNQRESFSKGITEVRKSLGKTYSLYIDGKDITTPNQISSVNPAKPDEVVGRICQSGIEEIKVAIGAAKRSLNSWRNTAPEIRAEYLLKSAAIARRRIFELSAWQVLEIGKQWDQAYADVAEAIDFLEYYAREMMRHSSEQHSVLIPGEMNRHFYEPKGIAAVIAPWNFPLAISVGMVSAAIVTGNPVIYKPSNITGVIGHHLVEIFREAGLPAGVFNFVPGTSSNIGDFLVNHPDISLIAFTGSMEVGLHIIEQAAKVHDGQLNVKKVIAEMGGKNAIIIDDDADLDEAIPQVLYSAFGFQGQKCSACSRVIALDAVYDRFIERIIKAVKAYSIGPAENPLNKIGAVADDKAMRKIKEYIEIGRKEGRVLFESAVPHDGGYYVPITIIEGIRPEHRIAQEEIFGPVLSIMRAKDFDQAIEWANSTKFALTGGIFSRSPKHLEQARKEFRVGNLYINRSITGALVERQPFGGFRLSGIGAKAGGADYLLHFMNSRTVTENSMRRGFTPDRDDES